MFILISFSFCKRSSRYKYPPKEAKQAPKSSAPVGSPAVEGASARAKIGDLKPDLNDVNKNGKQLTAQQMKMG